MPELPKRTSSTDGTASTILRAASASSSYGSANIVPISWIAFVTALGDLGVGVAVDHRPERQQVVEVLVAVDVPEVRAGAPGDDRRSGDPAGLRAAGSAVDAPGDDFLGGEVGSLGASRRVRHR